jgi:hypothetical protein
VAAPTAGVKASRAASGGLRIGEADNSLEREADRVTDAVMAYGRFRTDWSLSRISIAGNLLRKCTCGGSAGAEEECDQCRKKEEGTLQRKASGPAEPQLAPPIVQEVLNSPGQPLDRATRDFFEPRFGHDFSRVQVHADRNATESARAVSALAYTLGEHLVFGAGRYRPATEDGRRLIAHELTHVLQQAPGPVSARLPFSGGASKGLLQRRRIPDSPGTGDAVPAGAGFAEARTGLARAISRAWGELTPAQQAAVRSAVSGLGISWTTEADLLNQLSAATRAQLLDFAQAIRTAAPSTKLGDPLLIDTGARPGTSDAANITTLCNGADAVLNTIASGANDADLTQVFGASKVAAAKAKYANARTRMQQLHTANKIVTDRSGYSAEVALGGLSNSSQIAVGPSVIDQPAEKESIVTLIHESMHAGNSDVRDFGYIGQPSFTALAESVKLTNAAHFEIVPRRILGASNAFTGQTFVPAGTTVGGVSAPPLTPREQAIRAASETFRKAWTVGLNLHKLFVRVFKAPTEWNTLDLATQFGGAPGGAHFADALPFWSKVEMLTIYTRTGSINPAGPPAARPVTLIDISLSEGLIRKLAQGMFRMPKAPADAQTLETANATSAERAAAAASVDAERDLLLKLVIKVNLGDMTGGLSRDERVVARMAQAGNTGDFSDMLAVRPPSAFP